MNFYSGRLAGQRCTPTGDGESCDGLCAGGLYCSDVDELCHSYHGLGCNCTKDNECQSGYCRTVSTPGAQRTCGGFNLDVNETCVANSECRTNLCFNGLCSTLVLGAPCTPSVSGPQCDAPNFCRANSTGNYVCSARCGLDVDGCCTQNSHCAPQPAGVSCISSTCKIPPGNGDLCTDQTGCRNDTGPLFCAYLCNDTATSPYSCSFNNFCQPFGSLSYGAICSDSRQCSGSGSCLSNGTYNVCTPPVPLGGSCGSYNAWARCASPGNMCQYNGSSYICKQNGTTPVNTSCYPDQSGRGLQECVPGTACASDGNSPSFYACTPLLPLNATCTSVTLCAPPGNLCNAARGSSTPYVCKQRNSTAVGSLCSDYPTQGECISPATCQYNSTVGDNVCTSPPPLRPLGAPCGASSQYYYYNCAAPGNMCLPNASGTYVCKANGTTPFFSQCTLDNTGRSLDECLPPSKCRYGLSGYTCTPPVALGGVCDSQNIGQSTQYNYVYCAAPGNMCSYNGTYGICKQNGTTPIGAACSLDYRLSECAGNSTCEYVGSSASATGYMCTPPPTPIELGQPCGSASYYYRCKPPGDMCIPSASSPTPVCVQSRTTPLGSTCTPDSRRDECVNGTSCAIDGSKYTCQAWLKGGASCSLYSNNNLKCDIACVNDPSVCTGSCYASSSCCTCLSKNVADGGVCYDDRQCLGEYSQCDPSTSTCKSIVGQDCARASDCGNTYTFDCSCSTQKCYVLNAPTPVAPSRAPTSPTATSAPTPARCDSQLAAWYRVAPSNFTYVNQTFRYRYYGIDYNSFGPETGSDSFVSQALMLDTATQAALIDLACCVTCRWNDMFNSLTYRGYQVDCAAKTLKRLPDTCNDLRNALGFLNCWNPALSSASSLSISIGALLVFVAAAL